MLAYARRYEPEALRRGDWRVLARLHNAGWNWRNKPKSIGYANDVMARMGGEK